MYLSRTIDNLLLARDVTKFKSMNFGQDIGFLEFEEYLVRYRLTGEGDRTIVFLPNPPNMIEHYDRLVQLLSPHFKILLLELPGFGFSIPKNISYTYSIEAATQVVCRVLDELKLRKNILAFPCTGGFIALKMAELRPGLVSDVVSIQTLCWKEQEEWANNIHQRIPIKSPFQGHFYFWFSKEKVAKRWYERVVPDEATRTALINTALSNFKKGAHYALASAFQALFNGVAPKLKPTNVNALIIWGSADKSHQRQHKWSMLQYFLNFEPLEFDTAGHFPELERPEFFAQKMIERFIWDKVERVETT